MNSYQEFSKLFGDGGDDIVQVHLRSSSNGSQILAWDPLAVADCDKLAAWLPKYKRGCLVRWWELKPIEEIESMLLDLPLRPETYRELTELTRTLLVEVQEINNKTNQKVER